LATTALESGTRQRDGVGEERQQEQEQEQEHGQEQEQEHEQEQRQEQRQEREQAEKTDEKRHARRPAVRGQPETSGSGICGHVQGLSSLPLPGFREGAAMYLDALWWKC
jgi:hypothetical protein